MWKEKTYRPNAKSSLLTNYRLLKFRYSSIDEVAPVPDIIEGRPFAILVVQALSRHLEQFRVDFHASILKGQREMNCEQFVAFVKHYLAYRQCEICPTYCSKKAFEEEVRKQETRARIGAGHSEVKLLMMSAMASDSLIKGSSRGSSAASKPSGLTTPSVVPLNPSLPQPRAMQPEEIVEDVEDENCTHQPELPPLDGKHEEEEPIAFQTLSRMERDRGGILLHEQLVRLYRAIDVEDTDGVCWSEFSNFISDVIMQSENANTAGAKGVAGSETDHFELDSFVCDRQDHTVLSVKGVKLGQNPHSGVAEGFWLVQSRLNVEDKSDTRSKDPSNPFGSAKCCFEIHPNRFPANPHGGLMEHHKQALTTAVDENMVQLEWIPMGISAAQGTDAAQEGTTNVGLLVYSSTDLRLRLCDYRLQTGSMNVLAVAHAGESYCTMTWFPFWRRLFCCSNTGLMTLWKIYHSSFADLDTDGDDAGDDGTVGLGGRGPRGTLGITNGLEKTHQYHDHQSMITKVLCLPLDGSIASASLDPRLIVQDIERGAVIADLKGCRAGIRDISYNVDYHMIAASGYDVDIKLWVLHESTRGNALTLQDATSAQHVIPIVGVHFVPATPFLVSADSSGLVRIWDLRTLRAVQNIDLELRRFGSHARDKSIQQLTCLGDSEIMLSSRRYTFTLHPVRNGGLMKGADIETIVGMGYSFANTSLITATGSSLQQWDLRNGSMTALFPMVVKKDEEASVFCLDTQGRKIIVGFRGGKARVYSSMNGALLKEVVVSNNPSVDFVDIKSLSLGGMCVSIDSLGNVCCFPDRDEGCQFAFLETCGYLGEMPLFACASRFFPYVVVIHTSMVITVFDTGTFAGAAPVLHSILRVSDSGASKSTSPMARKKSERASVIKLAETLEIISAEFCDSVRLLCLLDANGCLRICQIGPTKDQGLVFTHKMHLFRVPLNDELTETLLQPISLKWITLNNQELILFSSKTGAVVALSAEMFGPDPPCPVAREPGMMWGPSSIVEEKRSSGVTRRNLTASDWVQDLSCTVLFADDKATEAFGESSGLISSALPVPAAGVVVLLSQGVRHASVITIDGSSHVGDVSLDKKKETRYRMPQKESQPGSMIVRCVISSLEAERSEKQFQPLEPDRTKETAVVFDFCPSTKHEPGKQRQLSDRPLSRCSFLQPKGISTQTLTKSRRLEVDRLSVNKQSSFPDSDDEKPHPSIHLTSAVESIRNASVMHYTPQPQQPQHRLKTFHDEVLLEELGFKCNSDDLVYNEVGRAFTSSPVVMGVQMASLTATGWRSPSVDFALPTVRTNGAFKPAPIQHRRKLFGHERVHSAGGVQGIQIARK